MSTESRQSLLRKIERLERELKRVRDHVRRARHHLAGVADGPKRGVPIWAVPPSTSEVTAVPLDVVSNMSVRTFNGLVNAGAKSLIDVVRLGGSQAGRVALRQTKNVGRKSIKEITVNLARLFPATFPDLEKGAD